MTDIVTSTYRYKRLTHMRRGPARRRNRAAIGQR
jgi:hypothetical protein